MDEEKLIIVEDDTPTGERSESIASKIVDGFQRIGMTGVEAGAVMRKMGDATSAALTKYRNSNQKAEAGASQYRGMSSTELEEEMARINQELEEQEQILKQTQKKLAAYLENAGENPEFGGGGSMKR